MIKAMSNNLTNCVKNDIILVSFVFLGDGR